MEYSETVYDHAQRGRPAVGGMNGAPRRPAPQRAVVAMTAVESGLTPLHSLHYTRGKLSHWFRFIIFPREQRYTKSPLLSTPVPGAE